MQDYGWPGNLRELEDAAKVLVVLGDQNGATELRALQNKPQGSDNGSISLKAASKAASREAEKGLILEALTQVERNLLYQTRTFAKFRQEFIVDMLTGGSITNFGSGFNLLGAQC